MTDGLFVNSTETPHTNAHVHHALKQFAFKTGCLKADSLSAFCSGMLRHCIVTNTRDLSSPLKNNLAVKMGHSRATADRSYNLINKINASSKAHTTVSNLLDDTPGTPNVSDSMTPIGETKCSHYSTNPQPNSHHALRNG